MPRDFNIEAKTWDQNAGRVKVANSIADAMIKTLRLEKSQTLLDFGAGTGLVALRLLPCVAKVTAVDSSRGMLDALGEKLAANNIDGVELLLWDDARDEALPPADVIVSAMTMHHIADVAGVAKTFYAALSPGGQIAIADLAPDGGQFHSDNTGVEHEGFDERHLTSLFEAAGFHSLKVETACSFEKPAKDGALKE